MFNNKKGKSAGEAVMWVIFAIVFVVFIGRIIPDFWDELAVGILALTKALNIGRKK